MTSLLKSFAVLAAALVFSAPAIAAGVRPDDRAAGPRSEPSGQAVRPDDRGGTRGPDSVVYTLPASSTGSAFDFGDAAIGAATGAGVVLLLSGTALVVLRRRAQLAA
jgi:hypothetical protein